jgi:hypothetical protein
MIPHHDASLNLCKKWCGALESTLPSFQNVDDYNRVQILKLLWTPDIDPTESILYILSHLSVDTEQVTPPAVSSKCHLYPSPTRIAQIYSCTVWARQIFVIDSILGS